MSWKNSFRKKLVFIVCFCVPILLACYLMWSFLGIKIDNLFTQKINSITPKNQQPSEDRKVYSETSPNGLREIILYEKLFTGRGEHAYSDYLNNKYLLVVKEFDPWAEQEIYTGDYKVGNPHWLGNDFIFFTGGCGSGCRGFYLINANSKESHQGVITTTPVSKESFTTRLHGWFGQEFEFVGFDKNIRSVYLDGKTYLIFEMWNNNRSIGEKKFIFTGKSLKEE